MSNINFKKQAVELLEKFDRVDDWTEIYKELSENGGMKEFWVEAAKQGNTEVFRVMGAASNPELYYPTLSSAVRNGQPDVLTILEVKKIYPSIGNGNGWSVLDDLGYTEEHVSKEIELEMFKIIMASDQPPDINEAMHNGWTPLHSVMQGGKSHLVEAYLEASANPNSEQAPEGTSSKAPTIPELATQVAKKFPEEGLKIVQMLNEKLDNKIVVGDFTQDAVDGSSSQRQIN